MSFSEFSAQSSSVRRLTPQQQDRLAILLERYLVGMEEGVPPTVESLVGEETELLEPMRGYVEGLENLHRIAIGFPDPDDSQAKLPTDATSDARTNAGDSGNDRRLGDFQLLGMIGRGGMGVVYRAHQLSLDRIVALKLLPVTSVLDVRQVARFQHEAQAAACLSHPHIVPVHAVGCERGVHFYAMQFIDGESVDEWITGQTARGKRSDWRQVVQWAIQAATALHAAHEMGVIHRDIKPSNLLLDETGKLWVTDFGLARYQTDASLTQSGDIIGTMRYMSPEQAGGKSALVDGRTDVYSLAVTLHEMLCLHPYHDGEDAPSILRHLDAEPKPGLRVHRGDLPKDLETVITKAMRVRRDDRYETAQAFADDLQNALDGRPTVARPPTILDHGIRWASTHQRGVAVTLMVVLLGLVGFATSTALIAAQKRARALDAKRAEQNGLLWRSAVDQFGAQTAELLADIPAADGVRRRLLTGVLDSYQQFAVNSSGGPDSLRDLALAFGKMGALHQELNSEQAAIKDLRQSEHLYRQLAEQLPEDNQVRLDWSVSQNNLARALHQVGSLEESADWFARAIEKQKELLHETRETTLVSADFPVVTTTRIDRHPAALRDDVSEWSRLESEVALATTLNNLGLLLVDSHALEKAEEVYGNAILIMESIVESDPSPQHTERLASMRMNLSGVLANRDPGGAIEQASVAFQQLAELLEENPNRVPLAASVVVTLNTLGSSYATSGDHRSAVQSFRRAIQVVGELHERWPSRSTYRRDLAISLNQLGMSLSAIGDLQEAHAAFKQALKHQRVLAETFEQDAEVQSMLGGVLNNLGFLQQQLGDHRSAKVSFREAVQRQTIATKLAPEVLRYHDFLKKHQHNLNGVGEQS